LFCVYPYMWLSGLGGVPAALVTYSKAAPGAALLVAGHRWAQPRVLS